MRLLPNVIKYSSLSANPIKNNTRSDELIAAEIEAEKMIKEARKKAEQIIKEANQYKQSTEDKINQILEDSKIQCEKAYNENLVSGLETGKKQGREIGFKQGYEDAVKEVNKSVEDLINSMTDAVELIANTRESVIEKQENRLPELATAICEKIIDKKIEDDPQILKGMIESVIECYRNEEWINIYLSKEIYSRIHNDKEDFLENIKKVSPGARIFPSRDFDKTDCVIELKDEIVDISVSEQLEKVKAALKK